MLSSFDVASYFFSKAPKRFYFNKNLIDRKHQRECEGTVRLNTYLHIAQILYIAQTGEKLFSEDLYAYDIGGIEPNILENYSIISAGRNEAFLDDDQKDFLDRVYVMLEDATVDDLIAISHEDPEWQDKHHTYDSESKHKMDLMARSEEYREWYKDTLAVMKRIEL